MGGSSTTTQKTEYDPAYMARINANYDRAQGIANTPFQPYTGEMVAGFTPTQLRAQQGVLSAANDPTGTHNLNLAANSVARLSNYTPDKIATTDLSPYLNPYTQNVIDTTLSDIGRQRAQQGVADNAAATAAHAFGGTRQAVQNALTSEAYDRNALSTVAGLRSNAFTNAQQMAGQDISNSIAGANLRLNAGNSLANISDAQLRDALTRAGAIASVGDQEQQLKQAQNDAAYQEFQRQLNYPYQTQALLNSALGAYPVQATTTATTRNSVGLGQILGGILGGAQTAANLGAFK